jgi:hypothetical protein
MERNMKYRYRDHTGGITRSSLERATRNLHKIGQPYLVRGYRYRTTGARYNIVREAVLVKGDRGTARFEGLLWGYGGEGPRGLKALLIRLGISKSDAARIALDTPRLDEVGIDWELEIKQDGNYNLHVLTKGNGNEVE